MTARSISNASHAGLPGVSPHTDNFASAVSPYVGNDSMSSAGFHLDGNQSMISEAVVRVKVGQSRLHNPAGRSSWVGL